MIHPRMATMLALVLTDAGAEPAELQAILDADRRADVEPADGRRRHEHQRHGLPARLRCVRESTCGSPSFAAGGRGGRAVARAPAGGRRRGRHDAHHLPGQRRRQTTQRRGPSRGRSSPAAWSRPRSTAAIRTGAASPRPPATRRVDGQPVASRRPGSSIGIAGVPVFAGRPARLRPRPLSPRDGRAGGAASGSTSAWATAVGEAFGCDLTEQYVVENSAYST